MKSEKTIRLLVVDDHPVVREGIRASLKGHASIRVVGEARDGEEALQMATALSPNVVLMDISMPGMNGLKAASLMRAKWPEVKILVLSMHQSQEYFRQVVQSGASGYVLKTAAPQELATAIERVHRGEAFFSGPVSRTLLNDLVNNPCSPESDPLETLSRREKDVLILIAQGFLNKEIAGKLEVSVRTAESHRLKLMQKLGIHSVAGLTKYAIQRGLIDLDSR